MKELATLMAALAVLVCAASAQTGGPSPAPWPMFHRDERHTGLIPVSEAAGNINPATGPLVRWTFRVTPPPTESDFPNYRWYSSFPLADLDGDGTLETVVTTPDNFTTPNQIIVLKTVPGGNPPVRELWRYTQASLPPGSWGLDQYSAAIVNANPDNDPKDPKGLPDVVFATKDGYIIALRGTTGEVLWQYNSGYFIEAGPMVLDFDGDGKMEIVVTAGCKGGVACATAGDTSSGALFILPAQAAGPTNNPRWTVELGAKADSAEPALAELVDSADGKRIRALVVGTWGSKLAVVWLDPGNNQLRVSDYNIRELDPGARYGEGRSVIRSSPLIVDYGDGFKTAVFGWLPDPGSVRDGRISAVNLKMVNRTLQFSRRWTLTRFDWKSSPALLPVTNPPLVVTAYGLGNSFSTGNYGLCDAAANFGGILALRPDGSIAWEHDFTSNEWVQRYGRKGGNVRASPVVADIDGDGQLEVLLTLGCYGDLIAFDGATGNVEWKKELGPRTIGTPSLGDLDADGKLEIVVPSFDGQVWALGGPPVSAPAGPAFTAAGVVNAASFAGGGVSPGEIITILGNDIGPSTLALLRLTPGGLVDTSLADTRLLFDGAPAPLIYVSARQVSAVVPYAAAAKSTTQAQIEYKGVKSTAIPLPVAAAAPGIFTIDASGKGQGAILNQDSTVNSAANPADKGSIVSIYATGEGQTDPTGLDGKLAGEPLPKPRLSVAVHIGGHSADVLYAGGAPGLVAGVLQVNARIPDAVTAGAAVPVELVIGEARSQPGVTLAVK